MASREIERFYRNSTTEVLTKMVCTEVLSNYSFVFNF